ncbi:hypothetical protein S-PM2d214 [Synechococcus phage S-PM2]|uniref:Hypothetical-Protein / belonging to T4-LIKE GC: 730 n=1 Tax=Synechococcus phage S-PM2 TaxID=238854 RepID=Q5GQC3_BPSYP|nr:Hypothetical-Protein / belonging to T4-LIKE GC: 730 [Synechococcus phage S-PM2]CAF34279.1 Hypothetical-Protein / belonging to T4-LIKE GC: 730 [Synechococcus phage S-PM2]CFW42446.1 hypothetical protein S-PM2d214 [Synechococcus phage S-PM2]
MSPQFTLSQKYVFLEGNIVRMYFIQNIPYTFDELPPVIQGHPTIQTEALTSKEWEFDDLHLWSCYLIEEEMHPLMFDVPINNPSLLPKDD